MPLLTRKKVLTAQANSTTALPSGLGNVAQATNIPIEATATIDAERIDRQLASSSITAFKDLVGQKAVDLSFGIELRGSNNGTAEPAWSKLLQACGFDSAAVSIVTIGSQAGTFRHGETVTFTGSGATATVVGDQHDGVRATSLIIRDITGTPVSGDTAVTGTDSGATAVPSSGATSEGYAWWPTSVVEKSITFDGTGLTSALSIGDLIAGTATGARGVVTRAVGTGAGATVFYTPIRGTFVGTETMERISPSAVADIGDLASSTGETFVKTGSIGARMFTDGKAITANGCRGNVVFNLEVNRPVRMDFTFRGVLNSLTDTPLLTGIDYENVDPPLFESSSIGYAQNETASEDSLDDEIEPCITTVSFDMGNALVDRKCAGATSGLVEVFLSGRDGSGSMAVEDALEADVGWLSRIDDNECVRLACTIGATDGNRFTFKAPGIQFTSHSEGDTDGIVTQDMSFRLTGGDLFDLNTTTELSTIGGDNELVLIYHTS